VLSSRVNEEMRSPERSGAASFLPWGPIADRSPILPALRRGPRRVDLVELRVDEDVIRFRTKLEWR
jgi:hypothetical protein